MGMRYPVKNLWCSLGEVRHVRTHHRAMPQQLQSIACATVAPGVNTAPEFKSCLNREVWKCCWLHFSLKTPGKCFSLDVQKQRSLEMTQTFTTTCWFGLFRSRCSLRGFVGLLKHDPIPEEYERHQLQLTEHNVGITYNCWWPCCLC